MGEGTPVKNHLNVFNSIIIDLKSLDVKIEDEEKALLLVVSLPASYKNLKEIFLYSNNDTLYFEDVKANLLSTEKFDLEVRGENFEGLFVRGKSYGNGTTAKSQVGRPRSNKFFRSCRKTSHAGSDCFKLKNQREKEESNTP